MMPKLKDAAVAVAGQIIDVERMTDFTTKKYDGLRVVIATGDGFAQVKLSIDEAEEVAPVLYDKAAWFVRFGAYANKERQSDAQTTCRFVKRIDPGDIDLLVSTAGFVPAGK
jgi:hypothetical protein